MLPLDLPFAVLRVEVRAAETLHLPAFPGSKLEGAFGQALYRLACTQPHRDDCHPCPMRDLCPYGLSYVPRTPDRVRATSLGTPPRPVVFRVPHGEPRTLEAGEVLTFEMTVLGRALTQLPFVLAALRDLGQGGLGMTRGRAELGRVWTVQPYTGETRLLTDGRHLDVDLNAQVLTAADLPAVTSQRVTLRFLSLTHLAQGGRMAEDLTLPVLVRALQRRVSNLEQVHGGASSLGAAYHVLPELAEQVTTLDQDLGPAWQVRKGARPKERVTMHGLMGRVVYEGDLQPLSTLLRYGEQVGVGKWAHFGAGLYRIEEHP